MDRHKALESLYKMSYVPSRLTIHPKTVVDYHAAKVLIDMIYDDFKDGTDEEVEGGVVEK